MPRMGIEPVGVSERVVDHGGAVGVDVENGSTERRGERDGRIPLNAKVVMINKKTRERMEGEACDLSMGGMYIKTLLPPRPGTLVEVEIQMKPLNYRGLARVFEERGVDESGDRPYGMAVVWVDPTPNQKRLLSIRINDHIRGGGRLLEGDPYRLEEESRRVETRSVAPAASETRNRGPLFIGLAVAAVTILVVLVGVLVLL